MFSEAPPSLQQTLVARLRLICKPRVVRQALLAAGLVGTLLVALNQGDVWVSGHVTGRILMKSLLTPIIPFCVTMLGAFLNSRPTVGRRPPSRMGDGPTEPDYCAGCREHDHSPESGRCPSGWGHHPAGGGENAGDTLCAILCVVLRRLCRLSASAGRATARGRHGIVPPGGGICPRVTVCSRRGCTGLP